MRKLLFILFFVPVLVFGQTLKLNNGTVSISSAGNISTNGTVLGKTTYTGSVSTTYAALSTDDVIDCTSGTFTVSLPTAVGITGKTYTIKNSGTGVISVNPFQLQTIDADTIRIISCQYNSIQIISTGSGWKMTDGYVISANPHATLSSAVNHTVASATVAYPILFESTDDIEGMYRQAGAFTVNLASPATVTWTSHKLAVGASIVFSGLTGATGITAGTVYYIANTNFTANSFEISTTYNAAGNVNTSASGSGTCTCISRLYVYEHGDYEIIFSGMFNTTNNSAALMDVWFVTGNSTDDLVGTNVPKSNTQAGINSNSSQIVVTVAITLDLDAQDFVRLDYRADNTNAQWLAVAAQITPTRPAAPSVLITAKKTGR